MRRCAIVCEIEMLGYIKEFKVACAENNQYWSSEHDLLTKAQKLAGVRPQPLRRRFISPFGTRSL